MEKVKIKYRVMGFLWLQDKLLLLPQNASECSLEQLKKLAKYWLISEPDYHIQLQVVSILLNVSTSFLMRWDLEALNRLCELSYWVFQECCFTDKKIPFFEIGGKTYHGPEECLFNCTFIEFIHADEMAQAFAKTNEIKYLDALVATLYRPSKTKKQLNADDFNGDNRRSYNYYLSKVYTDLITKLDPAIKLVIFMFFSGCKKYISEQFDEVMGSNEGGSQASSNTESPYTVAQKILARDGAIGDLDKVQNENLYNALSLLKDIIIKIENQNRQD